MVLYAHRQRVDEDGNHDSSVEVSAAHDEIQFSPQFCPATLAQAVLWLRGLWINAAGAAAAAVARAFAVTRLAVPTMLFFGLLTKIFPVTELVVVDAVWAGLQRDLTRQR